MLALEKTNMLYEHTERLLAAAARWLHDATLETASVDTRISCAFVGGYNLLQAIQPPYEGPLGDHPLASIVADGIVLLDLDKSDLILALALCKWEDYGRYVLEPSPASIEEVVAWAERIRAAALKRQLPL
jgi:hypothetical protein